jgi:hypothetical protein
MKRLIQKLKTLKGMKEKDDDVAVGFEVAKFSLRVP